MTLISCVFFVISVLLIVANECFTQQLERMCYEGIGCFSQESPWVTPLRPFPPPHSPQDINTRFYLITESTRGMQPITDLQVDTRNSATILSSLAKLNYKTDRSITVFINHGFMAGIESEWMAEMAEAYLLRLDANIFLIDWGKGAKKANYLQVAANIRVVSNIAARFLQFLVQTTNLNQYKVHCIGHSLGAHICGYMGKEVGKIFRISALDAAQFGFEGSDPLVRLNLTDANYIDVIHTNGKPTVPTFGLGFITTLGDVDFYFNGGLHQPGCVDIPLDATNITTALDVAMLPVEVIAEFLSCSHSKAITYFIEALRRTDCVMWGRHNNPVADILNLITFGMAQQILTYVIPCTLQTCSPVGIQTFQYPGKGKFHVSTYFSPQYCVPDERETENMNRQLWQWYRYIGTG